MCQYDFLDAPHQLFPQTVFKVSLEMSKTKLTGLVFALVNYGKKMETHDTLVTVLKIKSFFTEGFMLTDVALMQN